MRSFSFPPESLSIGKSAQDRIKEISWKGSDWILPSDHLQKVPCLGSFTGMLVLYFRFDKFREGQGMQVETIIRNIECSIYTRQANLWLLETAKSAPLHAALLFLTWTFV